MDKKRVLIIDSDMLTTSMLKSQLEKQGNAVDVLSEPVRALDHYKRGRYDMVILDALPPLYKGFDICKQIRKVKGSGSIPLIMIGAGGNPDELAEKAAAAGATAFEGKPFSMTAFAKHAGEVLHQNDAPPPKPEPAPEKPKEAAPPPPPEAKPEPAKPAPPPAKPTPPPPSAKPKAGPAASARPIPPPPKTSGGGEGEIPITVDRALVNDLKQEIHNRGNAKPLFQGDLFETEVVHLLAKIFLFSQINLLPEFTILRCQHEKKKKEVYFRYGSPINVKSNLVSETLGRLLVEQGNIDRKQLEESVLERKRTGVRQGDALIELGYLTRAELEDALYYQERIKIADLFSWEDGQFEYFWSPKGIDKIQEFKLPIAQAVLDGVGAGYSVTRLRRKLERYDKQTVVPNPNPMFEWRGAALEPDQQSLVDRLGEKRTVKEWIDDSGLEEERILCLLYSLLCTKRALIASEPRAFEMPIDGFDDCLRYGDEKPTGAKPDFLSGAAPTASASEPKKADPAPSPKKEAPKAQPKAEAPKPPEKKTVLPTDPLQLWEFLQHRASLNHYEVLEVKKEAQAAEIKKTYFKLAKEFHPDKFFKHDEKIKSAADDLMAKIGEAYNTLIDPQGRADYDLFLETGKSQKEVNEEVNLIMQAEEKFGEGALELKKKNYAGAIDLFEKAIKLNPDEKEFNVHLGWAKYRLDPEANFNLAKGMIAKAIDDGVKADQAHYYLAQLHQKEGDLKKAVTELKNCMALNKFHPNAQQELRVLERKVAAAKDGGDKKSEKKKGLFGR